MAKRSQVLPLALLIILLAGFGIAFTNRDIILDRLKASFYTPSPEMAEIKNSLNLTERGTLIFNATNPVLDSRDQFNFDCESNDPEIAVYGCYTGDKIYVYNINDPELPGFRESTAAHELLHAVWHRLSSIERKRLIPLLETVYSDNKEMFEETLSAYDESERIDELYVRSATQVKNLPSELESHFSEIFKNQDEIVDFYNSYITPFEELNKKIESLGSELESKKTELEKLTAEYESRSKTFNKDVEEFNSCANTPGCFKSDYEFNTRRNALVSVSSELDALYLKLSEEIEEYNKIVDEYNANILHNKTLQNLVNSNSKPETLNAN
ncbi:hypothetical protein IKF81_00200 [Candidatus Saccharibacteria bacterium]|nr:hypothetical protein [Candidatus Saccharibacteria bacterium]